MVYSPYRNFSRGVGVALADRGDIYNRGDTNPWDGSYLIKFVLLFSIPILFLYIAQGVVDGLGGIYVPILMFGFFGAYIAYWTNKVVRNKPRLKVVIYGVNRSPGRVFMSVLSGFAYGGMLVGVSYFGTLALFGIGANFSFVGNSIVPYSISQSITLPPLLQEIAIGTWAPVMEELLFASLLVATFSDLDIPIAFGFAAMISLAFSSLFALTVVLLAIAGIVAFNGSLRSFFRRSRLITGAMARFAIAISFGLMHVYAYGANPDVTTIMVGAMLFAFVSYLIDWWRQDTIAGLVAHSMNNLFAEAILLGLSNGFIIAAFLTVVVIGVIMYFPVTESIKNRPAHAQASSYGPMYVRPS